MILVRNHLPRLNGNKGGLMLFLGFILFLACSPKTKPFVADQISTAKNKPSRDTMPTVGDNVYSSPDTMYFKNAGEQYKPILAPAKPKITKKQGGSISLTSVVKESYKVTLMIPLRSNYYSTSNLATNRFVQFYSGVLLALEDLEREGLSMQLKVVDTALPSFKKEEEMEKLPEDGTDLVIGPFEREDLKYVANEAPNHGVTVISPWQTSTKITQQNPYYIQLKPNLKAHFYRMVEHACSQYGPGQITVITHNDQEGVNWFNYLNASSQKITGSQNYLKHFRVSRDSLVSPNTAFVNLFRNTPPAAVILPYYSFSDEQKLYEVVRRLGVDKGSKQVTVYGTPLMIDSDKLDFEFYNAFKTRVAVSDFVDQENFKTRQFNRKYFELFGELAGADALKGYDVMIFVGRNLREHGTSFQQSIAGEAQHYLQTQVELHETSAEEETAGKMGFDYYENNKISILEFRTSGFEIID